MFHQFLSSLKLLWSADINPCTIKRIANDLLTLSNEFLYKMSSMKEGVFWNLCKCPLLYEIDTCISILIILGFLNESLNIATIKIKNSEFNADIVRNSSNRHLCVVHLEVEKKVLIINVGKEI